MSVVKETLRAAGAICAIALGRRGKLPRLLAEDAIPIISIEGSPRDCGREYAQRVQRDFPGYTRYLAGAKKWPGGGPQLARLLDRHAPFLYDLYAGVCDVIGDSPSSPQPAIDEKVEECTSFAVARSITLDGGPISGQNKDTDVSSAHLYVVLKLSMCSCPKILTVVYPGEFLGYGFWSTGMSVFRNSLHSRTLSASGAPMSSFGLLALSCSSVEIVEEYARQLGIQGKGNFLFSDVRGQSVSIEWNGKGLSLIRPDDGIVTHANHSVGAETISDDGYQEASELQGSRYRMERLRQLLQAEAGRLTAQRAYTALADHSCYPESICRHVMRGSINGGTTTSIVAEPAKGLLHVTRGHPCSNWPTTHVI